MKSNELRIGNLLRDKFSKTALRVTELTEENIVTYVIDRSKYPSEKGWGLEPIPLTEEILFNFGFEKDGEEDYCFYFTFFGFAFIWRFFKKDSGWMPYYYSDEPYEDMTEEDWVKAQW